MMKRRKSRWRRRPVMVNKRRRLVRNIKRRLQPWKNPNRVEVKYRTIFVNDQAIVTVYSPTVTQTLFDRQIVLNGSDAGGLLDKITPGTGKHDRIGSQIFVKKIVYKMYFWTCPPSTQTTYQDGVAMRFLVTNVRGYYTGTGIYNVSTYFDTPEHMCMINSPLRNKYNVYHDKIYHWRPQIGVRGANSGDQMGYARNIRVTIPVNRVVTYDDLGYVKDDRDVFQAYAWAHIPSGTTDNKQVLCGTMNARIYYTDL